MTRRERTRWLDIVNLSLGGLVFGFFAYWPEAPWTPAAGNFVGASFVAIGALLQSMHAYKLVRDWAVPISWGIIVMGAFTIAGASLQMALFPNGT